MAVKAVPEDYLITAERDTSARKLAELMDDKKVGSILIVDDEKPVGIVTDRDLTVKVLKQASDPETVKAEQIMQTNLITADVGSSTEKIIQKMTAHAVRRIPIVDDEKVIDIVTLDDSIKRLARQLDNLAQVIEAETPEIFKRNE